MRNLPAGLFKYLARFFGRLARSFGEEQEITNQSVEVLKLISEADVEKNSKEQNKKEENTEVRRVNTGRAIAAHSPRDLRDVIELMEVPIVSLSKNRTAPIIYESRDGSTKVKITSHTGHYLASIYDWDIVLFVSSKLQESMNNGSDVPPRTLVISRHEFIKAICRHAGKTTNKEIEASLARLQLTGIETTINNEDYRYRSGFGFLDSWGYTARKDVKEFRITLSDWLYEITCSKGALLKVAPEYFNITSGLKRFLYRTARKHVGSKNNSWIFSARTLYDRSGSEQEFKKFKYDLKNAVADNDIPGYLMEWIKEDGKEKVCFTNREELGKYALCFPEPNKNQESLPSNFPD